MWDKKKYPLKKDVTIDGIISASYEVVSGEAGEVRAWERDFQEEIIGRLLQVAMPLKDFHKETDTLVSKTAFYESEINKEVRVFGNIVHVWSTYETRLVKNGPVVRRGINSIQLYYSADRWWIASWTFDKERSDRKIPQTFDRN
ncbi:hypothetical protein HDE68_004211 [Pedobacter cryoconitis]|uniref:DUF4440 domain-containing protein n=1 Tax=Pedobacter cryoconitis TaxID=188932 RepID=A0A7W8ZR13_9SPHI|nr:hypothetical protein [Pedobacter cryoconitis]MBB5638282.1 hypothetical protein [Pedobacter cryoconitis]